MTAFPRNASAPLGECTRTHKNRRKRCVVFLLLVLSYHPRYFECVWTSLCCPPGHKVDKQPNSSKRFSHLVYTVVAPACWKVCQYCWGYVSLVSELLGLYFGWAVGADSRRLELSRRSYFSRLVWSRFYLGKQFLNLSSWLDIIFLQALLLDMQWWYSVYWGIGPY